MEKGNDSERKSVSTKLGRLFALGAITVLSPIVVLSDQSIKAIYDRWFNECTIVFGQQVGKRNDRVSYEVHLFVRGSPPKILPLTFSTTDTNGPKIEKVILLRDVMARNRTFHPLSAQTCPGDLCPVKNGDSSPSVLPDFEVTIQVPNFHYAYNYSFAILMQKNEENSGNQSKQDLLVYSVYGEDAQSVCRLEEKALFNVLVWLGDFWRWFFLASMVVGFTICIGILRGRSGNDSAG